MATAKLGTKRICGKCSAKFYDLEKTEIICPSCETVYDPTATKLKRKKVNSMERQAPKPKEQDGELLADDTSDAILDDVLEEASELESTDDIEGEDIGIIPTSEDE